MNSADKRYLTIPLYQYECVCGAQEEATRTVADRHSGPSHCGQKMALTITASYHIQPGFEPYRAVGIDGRIVSTRKQHRDMLKEFGKVEVGNDSSVAPPKMEPGEFEHLQAAKKREIVASFAETDALAHDLAKFTGEP